MTLLPPTLLQRLARSKLQVQHAVASGGVGERRSKAKGLGIEFADHRPYQLGDDIRHLDRHVYARLGEHHVRQFSVYQQLPVTILLDASASMGTGQPPKFALARQIAGALAYVALAGSDRVRVGAFAAGRVSWFRNLESVRLAPALFEWLSALRPDGETGLATATRQVVERLRPESLLIVVSDLMLDDLPGAMRMLSQVPHELMVVHVVAPDEADPALLGTGEVTLLDAETGQEVDIALDPDTVDRYRGEYEQWRERQQAEVRRHLGRYLDVRSDAPIERVMMRDWRAAGVVA